MIILIINKDSVVSTIDFTFKNEIGFLHSGGSGPAGTFGPVEHAELVEC